MKSRIISGVLGVALALVVLLLLPKIVMNLALSVLCAWGVYELLVTTKHIHHRGVLFASMAFAAAAPFFMLPSSRIWVIIAFSVYALVLVCLQIKYYESLPVEHTGFAFFMTMTFPLALSCIAYLLWFSERDGLFYVFLALVIPWLSDTGAYFAGTFFGKHKLCPNISPKKTIEGLIGGIVISIGSAVLTGWIYQTYILRDAATVSLWQIAVIAAIGAPLSVLGDLFASLIKRQSHVKDFGNVMPGHGGVMDRFDSLLLSVPVLFIAVHFWPLVY